MDDSLFDWDELEDRYDRGILIGNGASRAVWDGFSYNSLFTAANLRTSDHDLFSAFGTTNFERVLDHLRTGEVVCANAGHRTTRIGLQYQRIRRALVDAVADIHVQWVHVDHPVLVRIRNALRRYDIVFSTNYDLLAYWAIMTRESGAGFVDYFWGTNQSFDLADASARSGPTPILYLHGGIHLVRAPNGAARKRVAGHENLLDAFGTANDVPLFVSEGTSEDKMRSIRRSDYLSFAYEVFTEEVDDLVVFGHRLGTGDAHIRNALRRARRLAISVVPGSTARVIAEKARYLQRLPTVRIDFFDATTHPLGDSSLKIMP